MSGHKFIVKFETIPETLEKPFTDHFPSYDKGLVRTIPGGYVQHPVYAVKGAEALFNLKVRPDDIWLRTFPRSGKIIYLITIKSFIGKWYNFKFNKRNNLDFRNVVANCQQLRFRRRCQSAACIPFSKHRVKFFA